MTIRVNGETTECADGQTLLEFLEGRGLNVRSVVVEHNCSIVVADDLGSVRLVAGDELEILHFVGGG
jgi:thiamine biosynthesis protein ThiS